MLGGKRFTTITTDAGFKPNGTSAFAYWIRSEDHKLTGAAPIHSAPKNSNEAELCGILNALHIASKDEYLRTADIIVVNCDNLQALNVLKSNQINGHAKYAQIFKELRAQFDCPIYYKHVKGHTAGKEPRQWINNWCDKELRKHY